MWTTAPPSPCCYRAPQLVSLLPPLSCLYLLSTEQPEGCLKNVGQFMQLLSSTPLGGGAKPSRSYMMGPHLIFLTSFSISSRLIHFAPATQATLPFQNFPGKLLPQDFSGCGTLLFLHTFMQWLPSPPWSLASHALIILLNAITCPFPPGNLTPYYPGWWSILSNKM